MRILVGVVFQAEIYTDGRDRVLVYNTSQHKILLLEAIGGTIGAWFAMWILRPRHKTQSGGFLFWFFAILVLQITGMVMFLLLR